MNKPKKWKAGKRDAHRVYVSHRWMGCKVWRVRPKTKRFQWDALLAAIYNGAKMTKESGGEWVVGSR